MYILPLLKLHLSFEEAATFFDKGSDFSYFGEDSGLNLQDIAKHDHVIVVGEPGIGKSELLSNLQKYFSDEDTPNALIYLRDYKALDSIEKHLEQLNYSGAILLDALDEVSAKDFNKYADKIHKIADEYKKVKIFLSSRWLFIRKYSNYFRNFKYVSISPFSRSKAYEFLNQEGLDDDSIDKVFSILSFGHEKMIIQIPRYLKCLATYIKKKCVNGDYAQVLKNISRNELLESFIYEKLNVEDEKQNSDRKSILKRILEKLALCMEIYQNNTISHDELMTFFDEVRSDIKLIAVNQIDLDVFLNNSLLKYSHDDPDLISFDNTEFQEYLAAKEICRLSEPLRATFFFSTDEQIREIYPSWYNCLTFLLDMMPNFFDQMVEFVGLNRNNIGNVDDAFFSFLSRYNPTSLTAEKKESLFGQIFFYFQNSVKWMPIEVSSYMAYLYSPNFEEQLKEAASALRKGSDRKNEVSFSNAAHIVFSLLRNNISIDIPFWKDAFIKIVSAREVSTELLRTSFYVLRELKDKTILYDLNYSTDNFQDDELFDAYINMCIALDPDDEKSLKCFRDAIVADVYQGIKGVFQGKKRASIIYFLSSFISDEKYRHNLSHHTSIIKEHADDYLKAIDSQWCDEIADLCKELILTTIKEAGIYYFKESKLFKGIISLMKKRIPHFVATFSKNIVDNDLLRPYMYNHFLAQIIEKSDLSDVLSCYKTDEEYKAYSMNLMISIKISGREHAEDIFEAGRKYLSAKYARYDNSQNESETSNDKDKHEKEILEEFRFKLQPAPNQYMTDVFYYYNNHDELLAKIMEENDKKKIISLITETVFKWKPENIEVTITKQSDNSKTYTTSQCVEMFGQSVAIAQKLLIDTQPYRQNIINFIPFASENILSTIYEIVPNISKDELMPVLNIYKKKNSDLWRFHPSNLMDIVVKHKIEDAVSTMKMFVEEESIEIYEREKALKILASMGEKEKYFIDVFEKYKSYIKHSLAYEANSILITKFHNLNAIKWRIKKAVKEAQPIVTQRRAHTMSAAEIEVSIEKKMAKPLLKVNKRGFETEYLKLIDEAHKIWTKGVQYHQYATYLGEIAMTYIENLKAELSYEPIKMLESKVNNYYGREGYSWLAYAVQKVRKSYLASVGKPRNISEAVKKYNIAREFDNKKIENSEDLLRHLKDAFEIDIRKWVESEGAYKLIVEDRIMEAPKQEYEKLIQKTIKTQIENACLRRGFMPIIEREANLLDDRRTDFNVYYGFAGPVILETKLSTSTDLKIRNFKRTKSYRNLKQYLEAYGNAPGIFLLFIKDEIAQDKIEKIISAYASLPNLTVITFDCRGNDK